MCSVSDGSQGRELDPTVIVCNVVRANQQISQQIRRKRSDIHRFADLAGPHQRFPEFRLLVVSELVDNAYIHGAGQMRIKVAPHPGWVRVEVLDEGEGAAIKIRALGASGGGH